MLTYAMESISSDVEPGSSTKSTGYAVPKEPSEQPPGHKNYQQPPAQKNYQVEQQEGNASPV